MRAIDTMSIIKRYELGYISRAFFFEQLLGSGQQTLAAEGEARLKFYIEREAGRHAYDYFILSYEQSSTPN